MGFKGTFSFRSSYDDAPNPFLRLDGYGHVGQPLNPTEAKAVIALCDQAPFDKGERTLIDTSVRDTWEMDASKVRSILNDVTPYLNDPMLHRFNLIIRLGRPS